MDCTEAFRWDRLVRTGGGAALGAYRFARREEIDSHVSPRIAAILRAVNRLILFVARRADDRDP
jgi:hypothetical protein